MIPARMRELGGGGEGFSGARSIVTQGHFALMRAEQLRSPEVLGLPGPSGGN